MEKIAGLHTPISEMIHENDLASGWGPLGHLFVKALIAALTSGLGGIPLFFVGKPSEKTMGSCIIFAAGLMAGCSLVLFMEALEHTSIIHASLYSLSGAFLIKLIQIIVGDDMEMHFAGLKGHNASKALLIILGMGLHSLGEGISVGVSAQAETEQIGLLVVVSLAIHNIPEGLSTSLLLISRGMTIFQASMYAIITNLPQPLMAIPAALFMNQFQSLLPIGFSFASGAMAFIVCTELIPESKDKISKEILVSTFITSIGIILAIAVCAKM